MLVADTANHVLRGVRLADGEVVATIDLPAALAGARTVTGAIPAVLSPWDVAWWPAIERVVVAAAGVHLLLAFDPAGGEVERARRHHGRGAARRPGAWTPGSPSRPGWPSTATGCGSSTPSRRRCAGSHPTARSRTAVGEGLFDFGHVDGPAAEARLQHPLGVTVLADGSVAVLDTFNGAVRRYDPATDEVSTLAQGLAEPSGRRPGRRRSRRRRVGRAPARAPGAQHRPGAPGTARRLRREVSELAPGPVTLTVVFTPPPGRVLDERFGPSTLLTVAATPARC